ncbi:hypothetical protein AAMO2058_000053600 [Amorphochlora amoebiformis]
MGFSASPAYTMATSSTLHHHPSCFASKFPSLCRSLNFLLPTRSGFREFRQRYPSGNFSTILLGTRGAGMATLRHLWMCMGTRDSGESHAWSFRFSIIRDAMSVGSHAGWIFGERERKDCDPDEEWVLISHKKNREKKIFHVCNSSPKLLEESKKPRPISDSKCNKSQPVSDWNDFSHSGYDSDSYTREIFPWFSPSFSPRWKQRNLITRQSPTEAIRIPEKMRGDEKTGYREGKEDDGSAVFDLQEKKEEGPAQGEGFVDIAPPGGPSFILISGGGWGHET